jgi:hypothetical protein
MSELIKVEIDIVTGDDRDWQWMGLLSEEHLRFLTTCADGLSDLDTEARNTEVEDVQ